jgi:hypothetical protein
MCSDNLVPRVGYRMKVFLSRSTKDKQFVQSLADELKREQIEPWLCEVDIELGRCGNRGRPARCGPDRPVLVARSRALGLDAPGMDFGDRPRDLRIADAPWRRATARLRDAGTAPC